jgi:hypothetical protein
LRRWKASEVVQADNNSFPLGVDSVRRLALVTVSILVGATSNCLTVDAGHDARPHDLPSVYDRYQLKINDKAAALVRKAADAVLFAWFKTELVRDGRETLRAELSRLEKLLKPRQIHPSN